MHGGRELTAPSKPALQMHASARDILGASVVLEAGQPIHPALPEYTLYVLTAHSVHGPPSAPVTPKLQIQAVTDVIVLSNNLCAGEMVS